MSTMVNISIFFRDLACHIFLHNICEYKAPIGPYGELKNELNTIRFSL